ncbi:MAG: hypothetical protein FGM58_11175, partial [Acidimicrobiia bacterium]|nr:hypothetical protein [Acidimicrobiia bacterium]
MSRANRSGGSGSPMVGAGIRRTTFAGAVVAAVLLLGAPVTPSEAQTTSSTVASAPDTTPVATSGDSTCPARPVRTANGGFEGPVATTGTAASFETGSVQGWTSSRKRLTLAASGYQDVTAATGRQFLVLSTGTSTTVHQDLPTTPSETLAWSLAHRTVSGTGTIRVRIGAPGEGGEVVATITDGSTWTTHGDDYRVPDDQTITRFTIESTGGAAVDLIDDASFGSASCLVATSTVTPEGANDVGAVITETVTVRNIGGSPTTEATLATIVPTSLRYVTDSAIPDGVWNYLPDTLLITLVGASGRPGVILPGEAVLATWRLDIGPEAADGTIRTQAAVTSSDALGGPRRSGTDSAATPVRASADVQLSQSFTPALVAPGGATSYSFAIRNDGPSTAHGVTAVAVIPDGLAIDAGAVPVGCRMVARTITCVVGSLPDGDSRSWSVPMTAPATVGVVKTRLAVSSTTPDPSLDNGTSTAMLSVGPPPGARLDIVTNPSPLLSTAGAITTIVADVTNTGSSPTTGPVTVTDLTPEPFVDLFLAAVVAEGRPPATCAVATRSCTIDALTPGQSVRIEFRGTVRPETDDGTTITGGVAASTPDGSTAAAELIIAVRAFANLTLDEITPTVPDVATPVTRIVTVTNGGPSFAKATSVFIPVPTDAVVVTRPGECTLLLGGLSCPLGDLPAGRPASSVFAFQLPPTGTSISDRAGVNTATPTEWPVADYSPQRWSVAPAVRLSTTLGALPAVVTVGDRVEIVVTAANAGPGMATDVIVPLDPTRNGLRVVDAETRA